MKRYDFRRVAEFIYTHSKLVILAAVMLVICATLVFGSKDAGMKSDASTRNQKYFKCITIEYGETLTDIAHKNMTEEYHSVNDYINEVMSINNLSSDSITSGATLVVPYYAEPRE